MINLKNKHFGKQNAKFKQKDKTPYDVIIESFKSTKNVFKRVHIYIYHRTRTVYLIILFSLSRFLIQF